MIETPRLFLKEYDEKYIEKYHSNFLGELETSKYTLWRPTNSGEEAKKKLEYWLSAFNNGILWLIHDKFSDEPIGFIAINEISPCVYGNIGIAIGTRFIQKGYASESLAVLIDYIKHHNGKKIYYSHFEENIASQKLAEKFNFNYYKKDIRIRSYDNKQFVEKFYVLELV